jgi:ubiquinone/menaquinone biosynthesis C-methylase UbiE
VTSVDSHLQALGARLRTINERYRDPSVDLMASYMYLSQYRAFHLALQRLLRPGARVLDWGAGVGHFAYVQRRLGNRVSAYTPPPTAYNCYNEILHEVARAADFDVHVGSDAVTLPFDDQSFDCVVSCGVLEHVREFGGDDVASLREIRRLLAPDGLFVCLHLPNRYSWIEYVHRLLGTDHHTYTYRYRDITRLVEQSSLRLVRHRRYGVLPKLQLARRLKTAAENRGFVHAYYAFDAALDRLGGLVAQNHFFVATRGAA